MSETTNPRIFTETVGAPRESPPGAFLVVSWTRGKFEALVMFVCIASLLVGFPADCRAQAEVVRYGDRTVTFSQSTNDQQLRQKLDRWYAKQLAQDCRGAEQDSGVIQVVLDAFAGVKSPIVHGKSDPYKRKAKKLPPLRSMANPKGDGTIAWGFMDDNRRGSADYQRKRFVWLVLDRKIYPLHVNASSALGYLFDGLPESVERKTGLVHSYKRGSTTLDQLGFEDQSFKRFQAGTGGNPFPQCDS